MADHDSFVKAAAMLGMDNCDLLFKPIQGIYQVLQYAQKRLPQFKRLSLVMRMVVPYYDHINHLKLFVPFLHEKKITETLDQVTTEDLEGFIYTHIVAPLCKIIITFGNCLIPRSLYNTCKEMSSIEKIFEEEKGREERSDDIGIPFKHKFIEDLKLVLDDYVPDTKPPHHAEKVAGLVKSLTTVGTPTYQKLLKSMPNPQSKIIYGVGVEEISVF